jgi:glutathionylspermidine synthase
MRIVNSNIDYSKLANSLYSGGIISDAWIDGRERFFCDFVELSAVERAELFQAGERVAYIYNEFMKIAKNNPDYIKDYFALTPFQEYMLKAADYRWHLIARVDLFFTADGKIQMCEMNSDTPSGEPECYELNRLFYKLANLESEYINPNENIKSSFIDKIQKYARANLKNNAPNLSVGIVYPTEITEDLAMIKLYSQWFEEMGYSSELGAPFNLNIDKENKTLKIFDKKIDILFRHYKTDWWGERISAWSDYEYSDSEPLKNELQAATFSEFAGLSVTINPFGSILSQNKLSMAFFYDAKDLFSEKAQEYIDAYVPYTQRLIDADFQKLDKDSIVLKSDYGCEGDEVIIGKYCDSEIWNKSYEFANKERWIVQDFFKSIRLDSANGNFEPNFGVYIIGGKASGIYTRLSSISTDYYSLSAPTYILKDKE